MVRSTESDHRGDGQTLVWNWLCHVHIAKDLNLSPPLGLAWYIANKNSKMFIIICENFFESISFKKGIFQM